MYEWLLFLHVTGAFLLLGGTVAGGVLNVAAMQRERPSEIALLLKLTRAAVALIGAGMILTIVFGIWLVIDEDVYDILDGWIVATLLLWVLANALGGAGGRRDRHTRELAERLAVEGDAPSPDRRARVRDPVSVALSYGSGVVVLVILVLMIWKPGAT